MIDKTKKERADELLLLQKRLERERTARQKAELIAAQKLHALSVQQQRIKLTQEVTVAANEAAGVIEIMQTVVDKICAYTGWPVGHACLLAGDYTHELRSAGIWHLDDAERFQVFRTVTEAIRFLPGLGLPGEVLLNQAPLWLPDVQKAPNFTRAKIARDIGIRAGFAFPICVGQEVAAVLEFYTDRITPADEELTAAMMQIGAQLGRVVERERAQQQIRVQFERLIALRVIDMTIGGSLDLRLTLNILADQIIAQLKIDAANVLTYRPHTHELEHAVSKGFRSNLARRRVSHLSAPYAEQAAQGRYLLQIPNLREASEEFPDAGLLAKEGFIYYSAMPLLAKGSVQGVLELFHHAPLDLDADSLDFLETLVGQAAIAIDNARLFEGLQHSNSELTLAYNATIEGWSRALELRDRETQGHTQRVTEMTIRLAKSMGISEAELVPIHRGALLHDIGKMGVPDSILHKPGKLTEEERLLMQRHATQAYEMLAPIAFLRPAIDIPYCHHEKWDGTGYPRGLKGEQIPLAARIFAIVDVWDALTSERPYKAAWSKEKARDHIHALSGTHFDPAVVKAFLTLLDDESQEEALHLQAA